MAAYSLYYFVGVVPEVVRVLRPGGTFLAVTHSEASFTGLLGAIGLVQEEWFCSWLSGKEHEDELAAFYHLLGRQRREQGFTLHEVLSALVLLKHEIWAFIGQRGALVDLLKVHRATELSRRVDLFFDHALHHAAQGFEDG